MLMLCVKSIFGAFNSSFIQKAQRGKAETTGEGEGAKTEKGPGKVESNWGNKGKCRNPWEPLTKQPTAGKLGYVNIKDLREERYSLGVAPTLMCSPVDRTDVT